MHNSKGRKAAYRSRLLTCGATLAIVAACAVPAAHAQDANTAQQAPAASDDTTTVVVTGIRKGIQDAITAKKKSAQIVEAVSAEDIGKLPDQSIAESLARLPGIAAQRTNGRAQTLAIRGLGPDFTVTTLNGREQVSTNDNRSVEFDQYPSELISQVVVYKTPNAGMTDQGIAGTADLQTVRPLAYGKRALAVSVRGEQNSESARIGGMKNTGNRYSLTYIDQFMDKKVGVAFGYAHTESPYQTLKKESWGYPTCSACAPADQNLLITGGEKDAVDSSFLKRDGYMGVLEFKPNDQLHMTFDAYHSDFQELQRIARLEYPLAWGANQLEPGYSTNSEFVSAGTFDKVKTVVENYVNQRKDKLDAFGWNTTYDLNDKWSLMADLSESKVDRTDVQVESTAGTGPNGSGATDTVSFTQQGFGLTTLKSNLNYADFDTIFLTDPGGWGGPLASSRAGYAREPHVTDKIDSAKLAATRKFDSGFLSDISVGYDHTEHRKHKDGIEGYLGLPGGVAQASIPSQYRNGTTQAGFLGSSGGMVSYDALGLYESGYFTYVEETAASAVQKTWTVNETLDTFYVKGDIDTTLWGLPVTGNMGLQSVHANQKATSFYTDGTAAGVTPQSGGASYTDILPTLNLNFQLADDTVMRFGAGTTIARPRMDDMAAGTSYSTAVNTNPSIIGANKYYWSGGGGNPALRPWKANDFDLSVEHYFGRKGYVSGAIFYKDLTTFIYNQTVLKDYTGVDPSGACWADAAHTVKVIDNTVGSPYNGQWVCAQADANRIGTTSAQANGHGGYIKGVELTVSMPGELIAPWLDGFGVIWSASYNASSINPTGTNAYDVPGLSKEVMNTTLYYEKHGFSARISNRYRGDFLGEVPDYTNSLSNTWVHSENVVDAQLGYSFEDGPLKNLAFSLSASNITNEPFYTYQGKGLPDHILRYEKYGSTYLFGVSYKFF
ncbi:MAG: TonB-dependent receptor [Asticcacaulis sp.]|uniref:TonB-dependent receptor n=1 Tax=Asticcacaulis sp. TaxID=1872648 RepID=UPI003F7C2CC5